MQPWPRAVLVLLVFAVLGPLLGGIVGGIGLAGAMVLGSDAATAGERVRGFLVTAPLFSLYGSVFAYWLGIVPALAAGAVIAWHEGWRGPVTGFSAVLLGVAIGALYYMFSEFLALEGGAYGASFGVLVCVIPTYLLSRLVRWIGRNDPPAIITSADNA